MSDSDFSMMSEENGYISDEGIPKLKNGKIKLNKRKYTPRKTRGKEKSLKFPPPNPLYLEGGKDHRREPETIWGKTRGAQIKKKKQTSIMDSC